MSDLQFGSWRLSSCAPIFTIEEFHANKWVIKSKIVATSGGFDPIHPGHISNIQDSSRYGFVVVIVNGDDFLRRKKGKPFMDLKTRCQIVSGIRNVGCVIPYEVENDSTVCKALEELKPDIFTKGGDRRDAESIPEWDVCQQNNIKVVTDVGLAKNWSSSNFLKDWNS
jgi:D-beta-D-heptose 7-phosphate kinase/D-beta-D-heptose 1-phosphate adenosyltransferase